MTRRVGIPQRVVLHIRIAIERLRVAWPPRAARLLPLLVAQLEPEAELVLAVELVKELRLVEADGQRLDRDAVHAARGVTGDNGISRKEAADGRVVVTAL